MLRAIGGLLLGVSAIVLIWDDMIVGGFEDWRPSSFGELAFRLAPEWLNLSQAIIQRYVSPWVWDPVIQTVLLWPAWPVLGALGLAFLGLHQFRRRRR